MYTHFQAKPIKDRIRKLYPGNVPPGFFIEHGGKGKVTAWTTAEAFRKAFGDPSWVAPLLKQVDFKTEQLVLVGWTTSGPPDGELRSKSSKVRGKEVINFYVAPPKGMRPRGERARIGADFLAIPRGADPMFTAER